MSVRTKLTAEPSTMTDAGSPTSADPTPVPTAIVAVDVGNTAAKVLVSGACRTQPERFLLSDPQWPLQVIGWANANASPITCWRIATVNRTARDELCAAIASYPGDDDAAPVQSIAYTDIPIKMDVLHPERVGIDRLLSAYGASLECAPTVIVDAGSAVTIDYVDADQVYRGGAILPGLTMQARSLASGTDLLPQIDWTDTDEIETPARDTIAAIRLGITTNIAAAVDRLFHRYSKHENGHTNLVLTGGDAVAIRSHLETPSKHQPSLVCEAILRL